jgi:hypothetical protein
MSTIIEQLRLAEVLRFGQLKPWKMKQMIQNLVWLYKLLKRLTGKYKFIVMETKGCM